MHESDVLEYAIQMAICPHNPTPLDLTSFPSLNTTYKWDKEPSERKMHTLILLGKLEEALIVAKFITSE